MFFWYSVLLWQGCETHFILNMNIQQNVAMINPIGHLHFIHCNSPHQSGFNHKGLSVCTLLSECQVATVFSSCLHSHVQSHHMVCSKHTIIWNIPLSEIDVFGMVFFLDKGEKWNVCLLRRCLAYSSSRSRLSHVEA